MITFGLGSDSKHTLPELFYTDDFLVFMQEMTYDYIPYDDFLKLDMPGELSPEAAWEFVSFLRRMNGRPLIQTHVPTQDKSLSELSFWSVHSEIISALNGIVSRASTKSQLWSSLSRMRKRSPLLQILATDLNAAAFRDGLDLEYETVRSLVVDQATPQGKNEQVIINVLSLLRHVKEYVEQPFSIEMIEELHYKLLKGAEEMQAIPYQCPHAPAGLLANQEAPEEMLKGIEQNYEDGYAWGIHPLFGAIMNSDMVWEGRPFRVCNGLMELILRHLMYIRIGIPGLCYVPLSKQRLDWECDLISSPKSFRYGEAVVVSSFGIDSTPYLEQIIHLLETGLSKLETTVERVEKEDCRHQLLIHKDYRLTHRQKQLLCEMIDSPELEVDIVFYQHHFEVAASTARTDLNKLVSLNFLFTEFRGKKQCFWVRPDMANALIE